MKPEQVNAALDGLPNMGLDQGRRIGGFIVEHKLRNCLELGFYHGVSSAYIAAALQDLGGGSLTTIDRCDDVGIGIRNLSPNIGEVLAKLALQDYVTYFFEPTSYLWRLMRMLEDDARPRFDFCYIDGAHSWFVDGFAFFLVERLLRPGGWILFDDLDWTYEDSESLKDTDLVRSMPKEEKMTPQVRKVYELLVKPHPAFDNFFEEGSWGFAQKRPNIVGRMVRIAHLVGRGLKHPSKLGRILRRPLQRRI